MKKYVLGALVLMMTGTAHAGIMIPNTTMENQYQGQSVALWREPVRSIAVLRCGKNATVLPIFCNLVRETGALFTVTGDFNGDGRKEKAEVASVVGRQGGVYSALILSDATSQEHIQTFKMPGQGSSLVVRNHQLFWHCDGCADPVRIKWNAQAKTWRIDFDAGT